MAKYPNAWTRIIAHSIAAAGLATGACHRPSQTETPTVSRRLAQRHDPADATAPDEGRASAKEGDNPKSEIRNPQQSPPSNSPAVAIVNDVPIGRRAFIRQLTESRGLPLLQQLILREAVRQEARRRGLTVTDEDVDHEYDLTLQAARFDGDDPEKLTPARREQLIGEWTQTRGVTRRELAIAMQRQACLRKLAAGSVQITEDMLPPEYDRVYGEKVQVRHIQLAARRVWNQVRLRLDRGEDFEDLVADYSQNRLSRERRGRLPPFSADDPTVPAVFAKVAFALEPGQVSNPIEAEGSYHVLKLERRIPARQDVAFDDVQDELRKNLLARLLARQMDRLGEKLLAESELRIEDQVLRDQYKARRAAGRLAGPPLLGHPD
jgi:parvulin-like peptidyl-prolyl isomerase